MGELKFLFWAYTAIWTALFIYIFMIAKKLGYMKQQIVLLKEKIKD